MKATARFFSDDEQPPAGTPEERAAILEAIKKRRPVWRK